MSGRNNQTATISLNLDFHTIGEVSFSFIDDKNKILPIDENQSYYFAGKLSEILFISKEYSINNNVITFNVNTYTEPFLAEITKRNTEIQIEVGYNTDGVQTVLLRDFAYAQPRVYIEGLNPEKVDLGDYYTKAETDAAIKNEVNKIEIPDKLSDLDNDTGFITENDIPDKLSEFENDAGFITINDIPEQGGGGFSKTDPIFLYPQTQQFPQSNGDGTWSYSNTLSPEVPTTYSTLTQNYIGQAAPTYTKTYTWNMTADFEISPIDDLSWVIGTPATGR